MRIFLLITFNLISIIFVSRVLSEEAAFLLNMEGGGFDSLQLPTTKVPSQDDENTITLCPPESEINKKNLEIVAKKFAPAKYCLFQRLFNKKDACQEDVKPMLYLKYDYLTNRPTLCGTSSKHQLHQIGFYTPEKFIESRFFPIYELCIDVSKSTTLWTKHTIMTPEIFHDIDTRNLQDENEADPQISTDALLFSKKIFDKRELKYAKQNYNKRNEIGAKRTSFYKMNETFIVPKEHIALRHWRKTVNHFINVAPLWDNHTRLMTGINDKIKKLALKLHSQHRRLTIYTRIMVFTDKEHDDMKDSMDFNQNIWIKLLYEEKTKSASCIFLQNTPMDPRKRFKCDEPLACKIMKHWYDLDWGFAYCCRPSAKAIREFFNIYLQVEFALDLDEEADGE